MKFLYQRVYVFSINTAVCTGFKHHLDNVNRRKKNIHNSFINGKTVGTDFVKNILYFMSKRRKFSHFYCCRTAFQCMRSAENLINSFVIARIIFYYKNIALKRFNLLLGFCKKVFQEFFIIRIKIVAHSYILYIVIFLNQAKKK